jgi:integrase
MKLRYWLYQRANGVFYIEDTDTRKQVSLKTRDRAQAERVVHAKNEALRQPMASYQMALAYLSVSDPEVANRTWGHVFDAIIDTKEGETKRRWINAGKDKAFDLIRAVAIINTRAEQLFKVLKIGTVSTNVYLRRVVNFAVDMSWLPKPIIPKRQWPKIRFKEHRAITADEHRRIMEREVNAERRGFYELLWHLGGSQGDIANLHAEDVNWSERTISFERRKLRGRGQKPPIISFGPTVERVLKTLPSTGPLFAYLRSVQAKDRATEFKSRCKGLGIAGVTLHSYRYSFAERARALAYPERYAAEALGHNSKAVHRYYSKNANVKIMSLEEWEQHRSHPAPAKLIPVEFAHREIAPPDKTMNLKVKQ